MIKIGNLPVILDGVRIGTAVLHEDGNFTAKLDRTFIVAFMANIREGNIDHIAIDPAIKPARPAELES